MLGTDGDSRCTSGSHPRAGVFGKTVTIVKDVSHPLEEGGRQKIQEELQRISNPQICRDKSGTFSQLQPDLLKSDVGENRIFAKLIRFSE